MSKDDKLTVRLSKEERNKADELKVLLGFRSISDVIRQSLNDSYMEKVLEGVEGIPTKIDLTKAERASLFLLAQNGHAKNPKDAIRVAIRGYSQQVLGDESRRPTIYNPPERIGNCILTKNGNNSVVWERYPERKEATMEGLAELGLARDIYMRSSDYT